MTRKIRRATSSWGIALAVSGCAHACPSHEPSDANWAEDVACHHHMELAPDPPADRLGCYRLALGPTFLRNRSSGGEPLFIPNPEIIELTSVWDTIRRIRSGFLVRTPLRPSWRTSDGVWRPTVGGALIDLGDGFSGLLLVMHRNSWGYSGSASTYQDVGDESLRAKADLWPVSCAKMLPNPAMNPTGPRPAS